MLGLSAMLSAGALSAPGQPTGNPLRSLRDVVAVSHQDAARELPVAFEATVTYFRGYEKTLFVDDGENAIYVGATTTLRLVPGDRILIHGSTRDSFRPIVIASEIRLLRHENPPAPAPASYAAMIRSDFDCRYVTIHGRVVSATMTLSSGRSVTALELRMEGGYVGVTIDSDDPARFKNMLDSEVAITGVASGMFDGKMQQTGILIHVSTFNEIKMISAPAIDAWALPLTSMGRVLERSYVVDRSERVRVRGVITYYRPTKMAVLQDGNRSIRVLTPQIAPLRVGDRADGIGIPSVENGFLTLVMGEIRGTGGNEPVAPQPLHWKQLASGEYAFNLVSMEGVVVTQVREHAQDVYIISADGNLLSAAVRHPFVYEWNAPRDPPPMPLIRPGSRVRITGVDMLDDGNPFNGAMAFGILMRTAQDVQVLAQPPWFDVRHLAQIAGGLSFVVLIVAIWGGLLRRKVHRQAAAIARRTEAEAMLERRRSQILEDINSNRPLDELLHGIADFVSLNLNGACCSLQVANSVPIGNFASAPQTAHMARHEIRSREGRLHGTLLAAIDPMSHPPSNLSDVLNTGARLAALAIDNHSLYSDLVHRSEFDLLTDIYNRFSLEKHLDILIDEARLKRACFGVAYIDMDDFKQVNDRHGHRIGDLCLQQVAERMKRQLRPGDVLARIGGDEFAAVASDVRGRADMEEIAARLERCFDEPFFLDGYPMRVSASVGLSIYPENGTTRDALFGAADAAMYAGKSRRRHIEAIAHSAQQT
jgi:diguanylate cyclase (GGDEF)-like protein